MELNHNKNNLKMKYLLRFVYGSQSENKLQELRSELTVNTS